MAAYLSGVTNERTPFLKPVLVNSKFSFFVRNVSWRKTDNTFWNLIITDGTLRCVCKVEKIIIKIIIIEESYHAIHLTNLKRIIKTFAFRMLRLSIRICIGYTRTSFLHIQSLLIISGENSHKNLVGILLGPKRLRSSPPPSLECLLKVFNQVLLFALTSPFIRINKKCDVIQWNWPLFVFAILRT